MQLKILLILLTISYSTCQSDSTTANTTVRMRHNRSGNANNQHAAELQRRISGLTQSFSCGRPKPQLVYLVPSETNFTRDTHSDLFPGAVVLHRCSHVQGYCLPIIPTGTTTLASSSLTCSPAETEPVQIIFGKRNRLTNRISYEYLTFRNHTRCECR